jgi:hypothetical protein
MRNIIFQVNIKGERHKSAFDLSTASWKHWADKNDCEVIILDQFISDEVYMKPNWQKWYVFDLLENSGIAYDKICVVDADTIVHPECPNFFDEVGDDFCAVRNDGCYEWVLRSIREYKKHLFPEYDIDVFDYFNSGFICLNKTHKPFIDSVLEWYDKNQKKIKWAEKNILASTEQTPLNFLSKKFKMKVKLLSEKYNLQDMSRKNLMYFPSHQNMPTDDLLFLQVGWVYHFNAIPQNDRHVEYWMERTYKELYK